MQTLQSEKTYFEDIFVVLTYKNTTDIIEFLNSIKKRVKRYKVIIVNSFYSNETQITFAEIAKKHHCDYIAIENKGYGYGNNIGIEYALKCYEFKRLVISNPDILIKEYDQDKLSFLKSGVCGGIIKNAKGKMQNPLRAIDCSFTNNSAYYLYVKHSKWRFVLSVLISKIIRIMTIKCTRDIRKVFAIHGSFLVITKDIVENFSPIFDEKIFMFEEEIDIAKLFKKNNIPVFFTKYIQVFHKEDGDVNNSNINNAKIMSQSCTYVYKKWKRNDDLEK